MSNQIGSLEIEMWANIVRLRQDMAEAKRAVGGTMEDIRRAAAGAAAALGAIGVGLSVGALAGWVKASIDAADALDEMAGRIGITAKELSGLNLAFALAGVPLDSMGSALGKLQKEMADGNKAFAALGVSVRSGDGSLRNTTDVLADLADQFAGIEDGAGKTALAMAIFGKSGADMVPLLNGGADGLREMVAQSERLGLVLDDETAAAAGKFNDTLEMIGLGARGVGQQLAAQLLPTLNALGESFLISMTEGDRLRGVADALSTGLKLLYSVGVGVAQVFSTAGQYIGATAAQIAAALRGDWAAVKAIDKDFADQVAAGWTSAARQIESAWSGTGQQVAQASALMAATRRQAPDLPAGGAADKESDYDKLVAKIRAKTAAELAEADAGAKLTAGQQMALDVMLQLRDGRMELTQAQRAAVAVELELLLATEQAGQLLQDQARWLVESARASADASIARQADAQRINEQADALRQATAELGLSAVAVSGLEAARLEERAATAQQMAQWAESSGLSADVAAGYTAQAQALRRLADAKRENAMAKDERELQAARDKAVDDYLKRDIGADMAAGFDKASTSLGALVRGLRTLSKGQADYNAMRNKAAGDTAALARIDAQHQQDQLAGYASMAIAARGMFQEGSDGYKAMTVAAAAAGMAQAAAGVANQASGDPYTAFARMASMAAAMASLGFSVSAALGGGGGKGPSSNTGTGTVLGDGSAQSESISRSIDALTAVDTATMQYSAQMLASLRGIEGNIGGLASMLVRSGGATGNMAAGLNYRGAGAVADIGEAVADVFTLGALPALGDAVARIVGGRSNVTGQGVTFGAQSLGDILSTGSMTGSAYVNYRAKKNFLDDWDNYRKTAGLDGALQQQFAKVFAGIGDTLTSAAQALGMDSGRVRDALDRYVVNLGDINLKGLTGAEQQERLTAVLSAESDRIVEAVLSSYMPLLGEFAQVGEGYLETLTRMATGSETAQAALRRLGVSVVELSALTNRQADDIGAELVRQSLLAAETTTTTTTRAMTEEERAFIEAINRAMGRVMLRIGDTVSTTVEELSGIGEIISGMDGSAQELADAYQALTDIRESLNLLGLSGAAVSRSLLQGAGSVERLQQGLADFEQVAYSDSERTAIAAQRLRADFGRLGLEMPASAAGLRALVAGIDASTESGQELLGGVLTLSGAFGELLGSMQDMTGGIADEIQRIQALRQGGGADSGLAQLQADFAVLTAQARAGDQGAITRLPQISQALLDAAQDQAGSALELARLQASTQASLQDTLALLGGGSGGAATLADLLAGNAGAVDLSGAVSTSQAAEQSAAQTQAVTDLRAEVASLREALTTALAQVVSHTRTTATILTNVTPDGDALATRAEA